MQAQRPQMKSWNVFFFSANNLSMRPLLLLAACSLACSTNMPQAEDPTQSATPSTPLSPIRLDQHGYQPGERKLANWLSSSAQPNEWQLLDGAGQQLATGKTQPLGPDAESGDALHLIDFSSHQAEGEGLRLQVGTEQSHPTQIASGVALYAPLFVDATRYFYLNRSGVELKMPFTGDPRWARPAGHITDQSVPCLPNSGCDYSLNVQGGWYDAGDYGKYVVNGGLSVWLLLNAYELAEKSGQADFFPDSQLNIPESGNSIPDILDEARFELEFLMKMQVPEGRPRGGMVHHKIHDDRWSAMGKRPRTYTEIPRHLHPPSTAATLNLAAVAAQAARLFRGKDDAFAKQCLQAALRAWAAAQRNPSELAPADSHSGGGPYGDERVSDEFYWAAAELWLTTQDAQYQEHLSASPHFQEISENAGGAPSSFNWGDTDFLGTASLLLHDNAIVATDRDRLSQEVIRHGDLYLDLIERQGYRVPFAAGGDGYPWGSNSFITNNSIVLAMAYQLGKDEKYLQGAREGLHFVLGRNANDFSYVSGYGDNTLSHPHHRFWAPSADPKLPGPPPGALAGGPNSGLQDPPMKQKRQGCALQKCYVDELEAYSVNEVAINWNASLAWVAAYFARN